MPCLLTYSRILSGAPLRKITTSGRCGTVDPAATNGRQSLTDHVFAQTLFPRGRGNTTVQGPHLAGRAINEIEKNRAAAAKVKYVNSLKVTSHPLQAGPSTDTKPTKAPIADPARGGRLG
ncbi:hypothetical protein ABZT48_43320 [Streptomyces avermitilis]|uniref:hypothetical protein n=1 Tax=Streptomyces avermitilis TaxID=33903 RepID=UPI0033B43D5E